MLSRDSAKNTVFQSTFRILANLYNIHAKRPTLHNSPTIVVEHTILNGKGTVSNYLMGDWCLAPLPRGDWVRTPVVACLP